MRTRRTFDREFKLKVLSQLEHQSKPEVCREHDLLPTLVDRWKKELQQYPREAFKGKGNTYKLEAKLAEAQRLIGQLYAENELLKKAILYARERQAEEKMLRSTK